MATASATGWALFTAPRPTPYRGRDGERGSAAVELVLITPVLIALIFGVAQTALVWHARNLVTAAAQQGARLARAETATTSATSRVSAGADQLVTDQTLSYLRQLSGGLLSHPQVTLTRISGFVTVTVSGTAVDVLFTRALRVHATSRTPVEGFRR